MHPHNLKGLSCRASHRTSTSTRRRSSKVLTVGCPRCQLFGCAKAWDGDDECDILGKLTKKRVESIAKNEKY